MHDAFNQFYADHFGERWTGLKEALQRPSASYAFATSAEKTYHMDPASVFAASLFVRAVKSQNPCANPLQILDACAAPGGKTLVAAELLSRQGARFSILANELSSDRRRRLAGVLDEHLTREERERVTVSGFDAAKAGARKTEHGRFDAILLDAPCSSERHVLSDEQALRLWTPSRVKNLAMRQWALLASCMLLAKRGAVLAYVTCALTADENDKVVARVFKKFGDGVCLLDASATAKDIMALNESASGSKDAPTLSTLPYFEKTEFGIAVLPDTAEGAGPIYVSLIKKL